MMLFAFAVGPVFVGVTVAANTGATTKQADVAAAIMNSSQRIGGALGLARTAANCLTSPRGATLGFAHDMEVRRMGRTKILCVVAAVGQLVMASGAAASGLKVCVPEKEAAAIVTPKAGVCKAKYTATSLLPEAEKQKLEAILPYVKYVASGVGGKPTIQISGANLQILSGSGSTSGAINGAGNLVIGYDETPGAQTGSHNLVVGSGHSFTSYGGILGGQANLVSAPDGFVVGERNIASGDFASVSGGSGNVANGVSASVSGGISNTAYNGDSVSGGLHNTAGFEYSSVSGGSDNEASGFYSSVSGGIHNKAVSPAASVSGGASNEASGGGASIEEAAASVSGGENNKAISPDSSVSGGHNNIAGRAIVEGVGASVTGGQGNKAEGNWSAILGGKNQLVTKEWGIFP
jgi:hypothetical protein